MFFGLFWPFSWSNLLLEALPGEVVLVLVVGVLPEDLLEVLDRVLDLLIFRELLVMLALLVRPLQLDKDESAWKRNIFNVDRS